MEIVHASEAQITQVQELFTEYWRSFGFTPCFQNFDRELASLPGSYAPPGGRLGLTVVEGQAAGCVALRPLDQRRAEFKRLYVRPQFRGLGLGSGLLDWIIAQAKSADYRELLCDTMPEMAGALALYQRRGFARTVPYSDHPTAGAIYLCLQL